LALISPWHVLLLKLEVPFCYFKKIAVLKQNSQKKFGQIVWTFFGLAKSVTEWQKAFFNCTYKKTICNLFFEK
jgi:hypothetical protein